MGGQTVGDCVDNINSRKFSLALVSWLVNQSASTSPRLFDAVQTQYLITFDRVSASLPQLLHMDLQVKSIQLYGRDAREAYYLTENLAWPGRHKKFRCTECWQAHSYVNNVRVFRI